MVYFTCGTCGEQVKKPQVEKHYTQKCRNCTMLTCIDCLKDFYGDEYKKHNQCMTEAQRYSKEGREGWDPNVGQGNKGEMKQQAWIGRLRGLLDTEENVDPVVKNIIDTILDHDNIPRKRPKFVNFVKNIMRNKVRDYNIEATWELFSKALQPPKTEEPKPAPEKPAEAEAEMETENKKEKKDKKKKRKGKEEDPTPEPEQPKKKKKKEKKDKNKENIEAEATEDAEEKKAEEAAGKGKKGKKRKLEETMEVDQDDTLEPAEKKGKFDWDEIITSILTKKDEIKLNKLKKKCISEFMVFFPDTHKSQEELGAKFDKKLKKRKYKVLKDKVRLAHPEEEESPETQENATNGVQTNGVNHTNGVKTNGVNHTNGDNQTAEEKVSWNKWEASNLGNSAQTEKFRRLMGIKTSKPPQAVVAEPRNDGKIFKDLEDGFERARNIHFKAKGKGLGFS